MAADRSPRNDSRICFRPQPDIEVPQHEASPRLEVFHRQGRVLHIDRDIEPRAPVFQEWAEAPLTSHGPGGLHDWPPQPHRGDCRLACGKFRKRRTAGKMNLVDRDEFPPVPLVGRHRDPAHENPLPLDESGTADSNHERGKPFLEPSLDPPPHLLAHSV